MEKENRQYVQPEVTRKKFDNEVAEFRLIEEVYNKKGIICLGVKYPVIQFAFIAHQLKPPPVLFAVNIDFTNYDIEPPSIVFIDPISREPILRKDVLIQFFQVNPMPALGPNGQNFNFLMPQNILIGEANEKPFLCINGVREYHKHPQHTGNSWFLYRKRGEGKLAYLLNQLYSSSIAFINNYVLVTNNIHINQNVK